MSDATKIWTGDEWQAHVMRVLRHHYPTGEYQEIPDSHLGDAGLEGYSKDGRAYQCYAPEEPIDAAKRLDAQRRKLSRDIKKFSDTNRQFFEKALQVQIRIYVLVVPKIASKDLLETAKELAEKVRSLNLPYVTSDFSITITTDEEWPVALQQLRGVGLSKVSLAMPKIDDKQIQQWQESNPTHLAELQGKIKRMRPDTSDAERLVIRNELIQKLVAGQNALSELHDNYNTTYEEVLEMKSGRESYLRLQSLTVSGVPNEILQAAVSGYEEAMATKVPGVDEILAQALTWEAIADWMCRCPLDFPEPA